MRNAVGGGAGRHGAGDALQAARIAGREVGVGGEHGEAVGGGDEEVAADDEVAVAVAVGGGAEIGGVRAHHKLVKVPRMHQIGVRMMAAEIG